MRHFTGSLIGVVGKHPWKHRWTWHYIQRHKPALYILRAYGILSFQLWIHLFESCSRINWMPVMSLCWLLELFLIYCLWFRCSIIYFPDFVIIISISVIIIIKNLILGHFSFLVSNPLFFLLMSSMAWMWSTKTILLIALQLGWILLQEMNELWIESKQECFKFFYIM